MTSIKRIGIPSVMIIILSMFSKFCSAQCGPIISEPNCSSTSAVQLSEGAIISSGDTYIVSSPLTLNTITMNGGELIICSTLNVDLISFSSGDIYVGSLGSLNILNSGISMVMGPNSNIYNFGVVNSNASIVTGANNLIYNYNISSSFNITFNQLVVQGPNTQVINNGSMTTSFIVNQSNNTISPFCLGAGSTTITGIMINNYPNGFQAPEGYACINIFNMIINSQFISDTSNANICYDSVSVTVFGDPHFGNATVDQNCPGCIIILGPDEIKLGANYFNGIVELNWSSNNNENTTLYEIERCGEDGNFSYIGSTSSSSSNANNEHRYFDLTTTENSHYYYKILGNGLNGEKTTSNIIHVKTGSSNLLTPMSTTGNDNTYVTLENVRIKAVYDAMGRQLEFSQTDNIVSIHTSANQLIFVVCERKHELFTCKIYND